MNATFVPMTDADGRVYNNYDEYIDYINSAPEEKLLFKNSLGQLNYAPTFNKSSSIFPICDFGFKMKTWRSVDMTRMIDWHNQMQEKFGDHEYIYQGEPVEENDWGCIYGKDAGIYSLREEMIFGYLKEIKDSLPFSETDHWTLVKHTPGTRLGTHQDEPEWLTVHIPIYTNEKAVWLIGDEEFFMPVGNIHIINSTIPHNVVNYGDTDRIHVYFSLPSAELDRL